MFHRRNAGVYRERTLDRLRLSGLVPACLVLLLGLVGGCAWQHRGVYHLSDTNLPESLRELIRQQPEAFAGSMTFIVLVDRSACPVTLVETPYWKDWQRRSKGAGWGFVMVTSRADSADLALAAALDSVSAPVLVMPGCKDYLHELDLPKGYLPMKLIVTPAGEVEHIWTAVTDQAGCRTITAQIDSVISGHASKDVPNGR